MKMIDEKFKDIDGRKHQLYSVRSLGPNRGFGCVDRTRNLFVITGFSTREEAWVFLRQQESQS